jgi:hypothetical protein
VRGKYTRAAFAGPDTGGIAGAVTDGENGYPLPPDAEGKQYAKKILD